MILPTPNLKMTFQALMRRLEIRILNWWLSAAEGSPLLCRAIKVSLNRHQVLLSLPVILTINIISSNNGCKQDLTWSTTCSLVACSHNQKIKIHFSGWNRVCQYKRRKIIWFRSDLAKFLQIYKAMNLLRVHPAVLLLLKTQDLPLLLLISKILKFTIKYLKQYAHEDRAN